MLERILSSLRARVLLLVLLALLPAVALTLYTAREQRLSAASDAHQEAMRLARVAAEDTHLLIEGARQLLGMLVLLPEIDAPGDDRCDDLLARLCREYPSYLNMGVADLRGEVVCSALPLTSPVNLANRRYFKDAIKTGGFSIGDFQVGRITGQPSINFGQAILNEAGEPQGVAFVALGVARLAQTGSIAQLPVGSVLLVVDRNGIVLARHPDGERWMGKDISKTDLMRAMRARSSREGTFQAAGLDGERKLFSFVALNQEAGVTQVYLCIGIPSSVAFRGVDRIASRNVVVLAVVGLLAFLAAWLGTDLFVRRHVDAMIAAARRLSRGDLSARTGVSAGHGELIQLANTIDEMARSLEERHGFVYRLIDSFPIGVIACDEHGNLVLFNRTAQRWHGLDGKSLPPEQWGEQYDVFRPDGTTPLPPEEHPLYQLLEGKRIRESEIVLAPKGQVARRLTVLGGPVEDAKGQKSGVMLLLLDDEYLQRESERDRRRQKR